MTSTRFSKCLVLVSLLANVWLTSCAAYEGSGIPTPEIGRDRHLPPATSPNKTPPSGDELQNGQNGFIDLSTYSTLNNLEEVVSRLGLNEAHRRGIHGNGVTIAVLDNGFYGLSTSSGLVLPKGMTVLSGGRNPEGETAHGLKMAEVAYAVATGNRQAQAFDGGPKMVLLNANGYSNFVSAIDTAIAMKVDIILYAQVWEFGGNLDGQGFINAQVNRAVDAGILWVNAAGNFGKSTWRGPVRYNVVNGRSTLSMPHQGRYVRVRVANDNTPVKFVLSWNDFTNSPEYRTSQDLNLFVENSSGGLEGASVMVQDGIEHDAAEARAAGKVYSAHAREVVKATLAAGIYRVRVEVASSNWRRDSWAQVTVDGAGVEVLDQPARQTVLAPADNPRVLTVGADDTDISASGVAGMPWVTKPDVRIPSRLTFSDGLTVDGTSAATAQAVGALAVWKSYCGTAMTPERAARLLGRVRLMSLSIDTVCGL